MIQQRAQLGHRNGHVGFQRITAKEIIEQAADRTFLVRRSRHVPRRAEGILPFLHIGKQRFGKRWRNVVEIFIGVLANTRSNIVRLAQCVLKEPQRHAQVVCADIHRRMGINKGVEREILIELIDVTAQIQTVFIPVKNDAANSRVMLDKLQQVDAILRPDNLKSLLLQRTFKFLDGLIFIKDAMRSHDGNDIHAFLLEKP